MTTEELDAVLRKDGMYLHAGAIFAKNKQRQIGFYSANRVLGNNAPDEFVIQWVGYFHCCLSQDVIKQFKALAMIHGFEVK